MSFSRRALVASFTALGAVWRLLLMQIYYGWEESDYGNLAMARGVLESGFRHYDMNHLPMFYGLSALVMAVVGDAVLATRIVAFGSGALTVALGVWLADRILGRRVAWFVGAFLVFQPELALYSASSLREPVYAAALLGALALLTRERLAAASLAAGVGFLTRMDALLAVGPALALHALGRRPRLGRLLLAVAPLAGVVIAWALYCQEVHGTWQFWSHSVSVNVETGGVEGETPAAERLLEGLGVSAALFFQVLPTRIGVFAWVGLIAGVVATPWMRHDLRRTLTVMTLGLLGFWLGIAFIAQHEPGHNLYWKWLHAPAPFLLLVGVAGAWRLLDRLGGVLGPTGVKVLAAAGLAQGLWAMGAETKRQLDLSAALYKPQLELAKWIEAEVPESTTLLVDNIPGCWLDRRAHKRTMWTWFDVPVPPEDDEAFAAWLRAEEVGYVLWFAEEWTQAPVIAPWLGEPGADETAVVIDGITLTPLWADDDYGWRFYRVEEGG